MGDLIRSKDGLAAICDKAREEGLLSIDTEFVWRRTYRPQLGIVQLGTRTDAVALDCLSGMDVKPLAEILRDASVVKILHAAQQDLTHLNHYAGVTPVNVFDTQLAAAFADFGGSVGLQKLLFDVLNVGLPKTETCTDWLQRPLSPAQVEYALDDVRYLPRLRDELLKRADALGTRAWLDEELQGLDDPTRYADYDPDEVWKRVKTGRVRLEGVAFAILRAVAAFREQQAQEWNLPRNWLGDDPSLVQMAQSGRVGHLAHRLRGSQANVARARYEKVIAEAKALPREDWPDDPHPHYITEVREAAGEAFDWLRDRAAEIHVDTSAIASKATVTAFVDNVDDDENPLASGWRWETVGAEMAERFGVD